MINSYISSTINQKKKQIIMTALVVEKNVENLVVEYGDDLLFLA